MKKTVIITFNFSKKAECQFNRIIERYNIGKHEFLKNAIAFYVFSKDKQMEGYKIKYVGKEKELILNAVI